MNELIVKLMMQATNDIAQVIRKSEIDYDHDYAEFGHFLSSDKNNRIFTAWKEKFAELVWKEAYQQGYDKGVSDSSEGQGGV